MISKSTFPRTGSLAVVCLVGSFLFFACEGDDTPTVPEEISQIEGQVTDEEGFNMLAKSIGPVEGAAVTVARVQTDGSLNTVSNDTVQTDASGQFLIETDVDGERSLVVVATKGSNEWQAVVSSEVQRGAVVSCQPLNDETTLEAEIYINMVVEGQTDRVPYANIASNIDRDVATRVNGNTTAAAELTAAFQAEAQAHNEVLTDPIIGGTSSQLEAVMIAKTQAQASLESALHEANSNQSAIEAAFDEFHQATIDAYIESGLSVESYAKAREVSAQALLKNATNLSSEVHFALNQRTAELRAIVIDQAVRESFTALGATEAEMATAIDAAAALRTSVNDALNPDQIAAAFQNYHDTIVNELQAVASAHATAIVTMDTAINAATGAKLILDGALSAAITTEAIVDGYVIFFDAIATLVETSLSAASSTEIEAISDVLIHVNMQV